MSEHALRPRLTRKDLERIYTLLDQHPQDRDLANKIKQVLIRDEVNREMELRYTRPQPTPLPVRRMQTPDEVAKSLEQAYKGLTAGEETPQEHHAEPND